MLKWNLGNIDITSSVLTNKLEQMSEDSINNVESTHPKPCKTHQFGEYKINDWFKVKYYKKNNKIYLQIQSILKMLSDIELKIKDAYKDIFAESNYNLYVRNYVENSGLMPISAKQIVQTYNLQEFETIKVLITLNNNYKLAKNNTVPEEYFGYYIPEELLYHYCLYITPQFHHWMYILNHGKIKTTQKCEFIC
jgi:hypothetical protein